MILIFMINTDAPSGEPKIRLNNNEVKINSTVELTCDTSEVDGVITWYLWSFANGTDISNTTDNILEYKMEDHEETLQFVCVAGNPMGQSSNSSSMDIKVTGQNNIHNIVYYLMSPAIKLNHRSSLYEQLPEADDM